MFQSWGLHQLQTTFADDDTWLLQPIHGNMAYVECFLECGFPLKHHFPILNKVTVFKKENKKQNKNGLCYLYFKKAQTPTRKQKYPALLEYQQLFWYSAAYFMLSLILSLYCVTCCALMLLQTEALDRTKT